LGNLKCGAVIVAAGRGKRMGTNVLKQYLEIGGIPVIARALKCFQNCGEIFEIVIVTADSETEYCKKEIVEKFNFDKVKKIVVGGTERQESVFNGLNALENDTDIVLIHDGVRPFVKEKYINKIIKETAVYESCVLGVRAKDTIKSCDENGFVTATPERKDLWIAQTPQAFKYDLIMHAYKKAALDGFFGTDDSMLAERLGVKVKMTEGDYDNIKITTKEDLDFGEAIVKSLSKDSFGYTKCPNSP